MDNRYADIDIDIVKSYLTKDRSGKIAIMKVVPKIEKGYKYSSCGNHAGPIDPVVFSLEDLNIHPFKNAKDAMDYLVFIDPEIITEYYHFNKNKLNPEDILDGLIVGIKLPERKRAPYPSNIEDIDNENFYQYIDYETNQFGNMNFYEESLEDSWKRSSERIRINDENIRDLIRMKVPSFIFLHHGDSEHPRFSGMRCVRMDICIQSSCVIGRYKIGDEIPIEVLFDVPEIEDLWISALELEQAEMEEEFEEWRKQLENRLGHKVSKLLSLARTEIKSIFGRK